MATFENSSHVTSATWEAGTLLVTFKNGSQYEFWDVPPGLLPEWESAQSAGKFFNAEIKGKYQGAKV